MSNVIIADIDFIKWYSRNSNYNLIDSYNILSKMQSDQITLNEIYKTYKEDKQLPVKFTIDLKTLKPRIVDFSS